MRFFFFYVVCFGISIIILVDMKSISVYDYPQFRPAKQINYLLTYLLTYSLHGAESFLRS